MIKKILIGISIFLVLLVIGVVIFYQISLGKVSNDDTEIFFEIESGMSISNIVSTLKEENLIKNSFVTKVYIKLHDINNLQAGVYVLKRNMNTKEILNKFVTGDCFKEEKLVTFIEGKRLVDYVKVIANNFSYSEDEILNVLSDKEYLQELINKYWFITDEILNDEIYYPLEGYLFPDTYMFNKNASIKEIIEVLINGLGNKLEPYKDKIMAGNMSVHEILTLASIVELEGASSEDRSGVAGVFYNRLKDNWHLGSDVTTYYAFGKNFDVELTIDEYNTCNPYNTRSTCFTGLPVGPICSVSLDSLVSTINPAESDYYYFVADKNKKTYYAKDYNEFNNIINELKSNGLWYTY